MSGSDWELQSLVVSSRLHIYAHLTYCGEKEGQGNKMASTRRAVVTIDFQDDVQYVLVNASLRLLSPSHKPAMTSSICPPRLLQRECSFVPCLPEAGSCQAQPLAALRRELTAFFYVTWTPPPTFNWN